MQLFLLRHAQSQNNALWATTGSSNGRSSDPLLTDIGWEQARRLGQHLAQEPAESNPLNMTGYKLTHLYCSLMLRAVQTGTAVAEATGLPLVVWEPIHEWGGIFERDEADNTRIGLPGPNRDYFAKHYPQLTLPSRLNAEGWWNRPAEEQEDVLQRIEAFIHELIARHGDSDHRVALVTHGGFCNVFLRLLFNITLASDRFNLPGDLWFKINNTSITRIDIDKRGISLAYQNRTWHLSPELITF